MKNGPYTLVIPPSNYPGKRYRNRYAYEHHVEWWRHNDVVPVGHEVHHINGNKRDNRIENLQLLSAQEHRAAHRKPLVKFNCGLCGKMCERKASAYRFHMKTSKFGKLFCSTRCGAKHQYSVPR